MEDNKEPPKRYNTHNLIPAKKGEVRNPKGRGNSREFRTIFREAMTKIAKSQNTTPEEIERLIQVAGIKGAIKGNVKYYNAINDRLYGPVDKKSTEVTVNVINEQNPEIIDLTNKLNEIYRDSGTRNGGDIQKPVN